MMVGGTGMGCNMKKSILVISIMSSIASYALTQEEVEIKRAEWTRNYFEKKGMPYPDGGVRVVPEKQMASYAAMKEQRERYKKDVATLGYKNANNQRTQSLMTLDITAKNDLAKFSNAINPEDTHIKPNLSLIQFAYTPTDISSKVDTYIGAVPYLTFLKDQGWVGSVQFFSMNSIGNCSFSENNTKLSHGSVIIAQEDVNYLVNDKVTTVEVMGTKDAGFTYTVEWFDDVFFRELSCANKNYSSDLKQEVIELAKSIDKS
jgi:hypothetical protein